MGFAVAELRATVTLADAPTIALPNELLAAGWTQWQRTLAQHGIDANVRPFVATCASDIPFQAGLSGSSALLVAAAARFATGCPSAANAVAAGCASPAGELASDAPWLGQTLRLQASGLPNAAFAITVGSTQSASLPLASVFATALPGCTLLVQPDVTTVQLAIAGRAQLAFTIPNVPALAGVAFRQQFVSFALDATLAVGATNALDLVVGGY